RRDECRGMHLTHLTLTGADDSVDPIELAKLSAAYPIIEWGILIADALGGAPRFPSSAWRNELYRVAPHVRRAAHICREDALAALTCDTPLRDELREYKRVQMNFDVRLLRPETLTGLVALAGKSLRNRGGVPIEFITQHNEANRSVHELFAASADHAVLF